MTEFPLTQEQKDSLAINMFDDIPRAFAPIANGVSVLNTWTELDEMLPFGGIPIDLGQIVYVIGRSGSGKTYFVLNIIKKAIENKKKVLYVSLEMSRFQIYSRILQLFTGQTLNEIIRHIQDHGFKMFQDTVRNYDIDKYVRFILNIGVPQHIETLVDVVKPDILVVDYLQIGPHIERTVRESINKLCKTFNQVKARYNTTIFGLSQVTRPQDANKSSAMDYFMKPPSIWECKETSEIENSADIVFSIARPDAYSGVAEVDRHKILVNPVKVRDQIDPDVKIRTIKLHCQRNAVLTDAF